MALNKTTQKDLECFVGTLVSTALAVWQAPLHYRNLQCALLISLIKGKVEIVTGGSVSLTN